MPEAHAKYEPWMARALRLARSGLGATYPNPCVGALVVKRGQILGAARSRPTGGPHAEPQALAAAGPAAKGAILVVTLEPCCHTGRTPPCTQAVIDAGIRTVVIGVEDPARHVDGHGIATLRAAGIQVVTGVCEAECRRMHEHYLHHVQHRVPFVTLKAAMSLDGRIATGSGDSQWITGLAARRHGHRLRAQHHAIAVGAQTALIDDPRLDVRLVRGTDPVRVIFDSRLRVGAPGVRSLKALGPRTLVLHTERASKASQARVADTGSTLIAVADDGRGRIDIPAALTRLGAREIRSLLVEGGGRLHGAFVGNQMWQRAFLYQAPRFLGEGRPVIAGVEWSTVAQAPMVRVELRRRFGEDSLIVVVPVES